VSSSVGLLCQAVQKPCGPVGDTFQLLRDAYQGSWRLARAVGSSSAGLQPAVTVPSKPSRMPWTAVFRTTVPFIIYGNRNTESVLRLRPAMHTRQVARVHGNAWHELAYSLARKYAQGLGTAAEATVSCVGKRFLKNALSAAFPVVFAVLTCQAKARRSGKEPSARYGGPYLPL
jgi:hypothetical protein